MLERFWFGCGGCHGGASCRFTEELGSGTGPVRTGVASLPIPLTAMTVFLLPLACAIGGAFLTGRLWADDAHASVAGWQTAGALAGLAAGVGLAKLLLHLMDRIRSHLNRGGQ